MDHGQYMSMPGVGQGAVMGMGAPMVMPQQMPHQMPMQEMPMQQMPMQQMQQPQRMAAPGGMQSGKPSDSQLLANFPAGSVVLPEHNVSAVCRAVFLLLSSLFSLLRRACTHRVIETTRVCYAGLKVNTLSMTMELCKRTVRRP